MGNRNNVNFYLCEWLGILIMFVFFPIALLGLLLLVNEYKATGLPYGAVDCDGPVGVMMFVMPSIFVYSLGLFFYSVGFAFKNHFLYLIIIMFCLLMLLLLIPKGKEAIKETKLPMYVEVCG